MIIHKTGAVGPTCIKSMTASQVQELFATPQRSLAARNFLEMLSMQYQVVRCRIKNPVPHPLSTAVKAAISRSKP